MNYEEINALEITNEDVLQELTNHLISKEPKVELEVGEEPPVYEYSDEELEAELLLYQSELIAVEDERLRVKDLQYRFKKLDSAYQRVHSTRPNAALWFRDEVLANQDHDEAEALIVELEVKDVEFQAQIQSNAWIKDRKKWYKDHDDQLKEAIVERELGDPIKWDAYIALRTQMKIDISKP